MRAERACAILRYDCNPLLDPLVARTDRELLASSPQRANAEGLGPHLSPFPISPWLPHVWTQE